MEKTFRFSDVKKMTIARFEDLAVEGVPPRFDKFGPGSFVVLVRYCDGRQEAFRPEDGFSLVFHDK